VVTEVTELMQQLVIKPHLVIDEMEAMVEIEVMEGNEVTDDNLVLVFHRHEVIDEIVKLEIFDCLLFLDDLYHLQEL
jgi:hypothetical protein